MVVEKIIQKLLSYVGSHIYDIHAFIASLLVLGVLVIAQRKLNDVIVRKIDKNIEKKPNLSDKRDTYIRRSGMIYIAAIFPTSMVMSLLVDLVSPLVEFSIPAVVMCAVYVLFEYAILRQIAYRGTV